MKRVRESKEVTRYKEREGVRQGREKKKRQKRESEKEIDRSRRTRGDSVGGGGGKGDQGKRKERVKNWARIGEKEEEKEIKKER